MVGTTILLLLLFLLLLGFICLFTPQKPKNTPITEEVNDWEYQKEQARKESKAEQNKEWFKEGRWLTDKEIDWAVEKMSKEQQMPGSFPGQETPGRFKILPAHQFHLVREAQKWSKEEELFTYLLSELTDATAELVFIPVNQPNFHWSLLVYEAKTKTFYHYDTLRGVNWNYVKDLVYELLKELEVPNHLTGQHFYARHKIRQNNGWECGVAILAIIRRIKEKYGGDMNNTELGGLDFAKEREKLREKYLQEINP
ncbi:MAG: hypothetical protein MRERV_13c006 [Mycoplasmataceae bacterium RV_VA103A]|nr:MAG: hypothetical protein MRERV_13c006 [Mycoplasmataceae bacterium RV_VA103A]